MYRRIGIILNRRNVGQHDRRITLFGTDGKHELRARGTQKFESKLAGSLEPLTLVELTTVQGRGGEQVTGSSIRDAYRAIHDSVPKLAAAGLVATAVDTMVHGWHDDALLLKRIRESFALIGRSRTNRQLFLGVAYGLHHLLACSGYAAVPARQSTPRDRLISVLLRGEVRVLSRVRCSVPTARACVDSAVFQLRQHADRDVPAAHFFSYMTATAR